MGIIENLEQMLAQGRDDPLLRFSLGSAYLNAGEAERAVEHLAEAVRQQPDYSAAWKHYGKALAILGRAQEAIAVYRDGIAAAEARGDLQAAREMKVYLKRLERT